jgi:hypothetical protein
MKLCNTLCLLLFLIVISGCKAPQTGAKSAKEDNSISYSQAFSITASDLPDIIPALCNDLGMTIEETSENPQRYEATCQSLTGLEVKIEGVTFVKGKTLVGITVQAKGRKDLVAKAVYDETWRRLKRATEIYQKD